MTTSPRWRGLAADLMPFLVGGALQFATVRWVVPRATLGGLEPIAAWMLLSIPLVFLPIVGLGLMLLRGERDRPSWRERLRLRRICARDVGWGLVGVVGSAVAAYGATRWSPSVAVECILMGRFPCRVRARECPGSGSDTGSGSIDRPEASEHLAGRAHALCAFTRWIHRHRRWLGSWIERGCGLGPESWTAAPAGMPVGDDCSRASQLSCIGRVPS